MLLRGRGLSSRGSCICQIITRRNNTTPCPEHLVNVAMASSSSSAARLNWRVAIRNTASYTCIQWRRAAGLRLVHSLKANGWQQKLRPPMLVPQQLPQHQHPQQSPSTSRGPLAPPTHLELVLALPVAALAAQRLGLHANEAGQCMSKRQRRGQGRSYAPSWASQHQRRAAKHCGGEAARCKPAQTAPNSGIML